MQIDLHGVSLLPPGFVGDSQWQSDEYIPAALVGQNIAAATDVLKVTIPPHLPYRRVYFYIEACVSSAGFDYFVTGRLSFLKNGKRVQDVEACIGKDTSGTLLTAKSIIGIVNPSSAFQGDSKLLVTASKFTGGADTVVLVPQRFITDADQITYSITAAKGGGGAFVTCVRVYLGVQSTNYNF